MTDPLVSIDHKVQIAGHVLTEEIEDEAILLHLENEEYFALDNVGTQMLNALKATDSIQAAYEQLINIYQVEPATLRQDLIDYVQELHQVGLIDILAP